MADKKFDIDLDAVVDVVASTSTSARQKLAAELEKKTKYTVDMSRQARKIERELRVLGKKLEEFPTDEGGVREKVVEEISKLEGLPIISVKPYPGYAVVIETEKLKRGRRIIGNFKIKLDFREDIEDFLLAINYYQRVRNHYDHPAISHGKVCWGNKLGGAAKEAFRERNLSDLLETFIDLVQETTDSETYIKWSEFFEDAERMPGNFEHAIFSNLERLATPDSSGATPLDEEENEAVRSRQIHVLEAMVRDVSRRIPRELVDLAERASHGHFREVDLRNQILDRLLHGNAGREAMESNNWDFNRMVERVMSLVNLFRQLRQLRGGTDRILRPTPMARVFESSEIPDASPATYTDIISAGTTLSPTTGIDVSAAADPGFSTASAMFRTTYGDSEAETEEAVHSGERMADEFNRGMETISERIDSRVEALGEDTDNATDNMARRMMRLMGLRGDSGTDNENNENNENTGS